MASFTLDQARKAADKANRLNFRIAEIISLELGARSSPNAGKPIGVFKDMDKHLERDGSAVRMHTYDNMLYQPAAISYGPSTSHWTTTKDVVVDSVTDWGYLGLGYWGMARQIPVIERQTQHHSSTSASGALTLGIERGTAPQVKDWPAGLCWADHLASIYFDFLSDRECLEWYIIPSGSHGRGRDAINDSCGLRCDPILEVGIMYDGSGLVLRNKHSGESYGNFDHAKEAAEALKTGPIDFILKYACR